ncbi:hypothetical protein TIFTF001_053035 [Ficus carica]|uniref:Uncharacterized protein n=1 Tax=Ficus carica TaxID=3494 RepID=A0AA88EL23_FICCA|nr:hypothetical protein TIFTF001_053035 [Ficus carica]
MASSCFSKATP